MWDPERTLKGGQDIIQLLQVVTCKGREDFAAFMFFVVLQVFHNLGSRRLLHPERGRPKLQTSSGPELQKFWGPSSIRLYGF